MVCWCWSSSEKRSWLVCGRLEIKENRNGDNKER